MSVVDTFYFLFKTDAKSASQDVASLDQQINNLALKGKKRTEEETKQLKELRALRTAQTQDIKEQTKSVDTLSDSLVSMGVSALTSFSGFEAIKKIATDSQNLNLSLQRTRNLTGQNAEEVYAWDQAFTSLGADKGAFQSWFIGYSQLLQSTGQDTKNAIPDIKRLSDELRGLDEAAARTKFQQIAAVYKLPPELFEPMRRGGADLQIIVDGFAKLNKSTEESEQRALALAAAWDRVTAAFQGRGTEGNDSIFSRLTNGLNALSVAIAQHLPLMTDFAIFMAAFFGSTAKTPVSPTIPSLSGHQPLGIRSNNPGNLQPGGVEAVYPTLDAGIAAEQAQLQRYGSSGKNTLASIAASWPDQAHASSWLAAVQRYTGFGANQPLDLNDPATRAKVAQGINFAEGDVAANAAFAGHAAIAQADQSSLNTLSTSGSGNETNVKIDKIEVHTQATNATDISDAIANELEKAYRAVVGNHDDGIVK